MAATTETACQQVYSISCELEKCLMDLKEDKNKLEEKLREQSHQHQKLLKFLTDASHSDHQKQQHLEQLHSSLKNDCTNLLRKKKRKKKA